MYQRRLQKMGREPSEPSVKKKRREELCELSVDSEFEISRTEEI